MSDIQLNDPQTLYHRWEDSQWSPFDVDLSVDQEQWPALDPAIREIIYFALSSLMVAEERITTKFAGLIAAHRSEEETTFLATQLVDEARHMQFYARFRDEVIAEPQPIAAHVGRAREQVSDSFRELFDGLLCGCMTSSSQSRRHGRQGPLRHALPPRAGEHARPDHLQIRDRLPEEQELLPGFVEGYSKIHHDETRHIGYGVWFLRETVREHPEQGDTVRETLRQLLPAVAESLKPPGGRDGSGELLGVTQDEIRQFALDGMTRRLDIIGVPLETVLS